MSTYKVIQDIEAEDKLLGPLTLRQFIYGGIAATSGYLTFLAVVKGAGFLAVIFVPIVIFTGFFAFPWGKDQPTEVWALAKIRFLLKPRKRIWNQSATKELVTITVPRVIERALTNGLNQREVNSRLRALADTIDSRGWAVKNVSVSMYNQGIQQTTANSDRLVSASMLPQEVSSVDVSASDDILDESANPIAQHFDSMINASSQARHQDLVALMQQPTLDPLIQPQISQTQSAQSDYWFLQKPIISNTSQSTITAPPAQTQAGLPTPQAAIPTAEEQAMVAKFKAENDNQMKASYGHMKVIKTPEELAEEASRTQLEEERIRTAAVVLAQRESADKAQVTLDNQAVIMNLSRSNDLNVETLARQVNKPIASQTEDGEVVIPLR